MEPSTTIRKMMAGNKIIVPAYQRAYSWDTPDEDSERKTQTDVFLSDLEDYCQSNSVSPYYFGHFLFEEKNSIYDVIDGQQRLTTIVIFLSALFNTINLKRKLNDDEQNIYEDIIRRRREVRFSTVGYDNQLFVDYVIDQNKADRNNLETDSAKRIVSAFDYFKSQLRNKDEKYIDKILSAISNATCTTHLVRKESEAIQMFIFQNSRGKKPSNLEIVKAQFMYNVHLYGGDETNSLISELKNRFESIYKSISRVEYRIDEDDVLNITQKVYYDSLWESNVLDRINRELSGKKSIDFVIKFTRALTDTFEKLVLFFNRDERNFDIHSLITLGNINIILPFIIKAYSFGISVKEIGLLAKSFESIILRHRVIGTRAEIISRINDRYINFNEKTHDVKTIIEHINWLKKTKDWYWAYWNDNQLRASLCGSMNHNVAKYLLWKYENYLESLGKSGYLPRRYDTIEKPELEHIAPMKEPKGKNHGYDKYDEEFCNQYIDCLGNYLLLSKSHNASIHNDPFENKLKDYTYLEQQREIKKFIDEKNPKWTKKEIELRKEKIIGFIISEL
jgi:hypothetical protein